MSDRHDINEIYIQNTGTSNVNFPCYIHSLYIKTGFLDLYTDKDIH